MRKHNLFLLIALLPIFVLGEMDHLVISEIVLQPKEREFVTIYNPTDAALDLSNYYLTDGTDTVNGKFYYNLLTGSDFYSGSGTDFIVRFPDSYSIPAKSSVLISITTKSAYESNYGEMPDLSIKEDFRHAVDTMSTIGTAPYYLDDYKETLVLFYWDGSSPTVQDVDYIVWGSTEFAVDKSAVVGYTADTPVEQQDFIPKFAIFQIHENGQKLKRINGEGAEKQSDGNGITGHDETSEDFSNTWIAVSVGNTKPNISNVTISPENPTIEDKIKISAKVTDDSLVAEVDLVYEFEGVKESIAMQKNEGDNYSITLDPFTETGTLLYYVLAMDASGLKDSSLTYNVAIQEPQEEITIAMIRENWSDWEGQTVTLRGVVTIGSNILRTDRTSAYFQDASGKGLNLYDGA
ncbi:lamin tail domain-containing protein, partial [bacterium]|nr:lamin tail domain-containing protein [bacterium]